MLEQFCLSMCCDLCMCCLYFLFFSFSRCDSPEKLKALLPRLEQELKDSGKFKDFYQFTFNFAKNPGQKGLGKFTDCDLTIDFLTNIIDSQTSEQSCFICVDLEMAVAYWNLVLSGRFKFLDLWNRFLLVSQRSKTGHDGPWISAY